MKQNFKKYLCLFLCLVLAFFAFSCSKEGGRIENPKVKDWIQPTVTGEESPFNGTEGIWKDATYLADKEFGDGEKRVDVIVEAEDSAVIFTFYTDKSNLADVLLEYKLVEGEEGAYGLYIKKVNGMTADYNVDQSYWAFCRNGEMQTTGVSDTKIEDGDRFELVYTK